MNLSVVQKAMVAEPLSADELALLPRLLDLSADELALLTSRGGAG